MTLKRNFWLLLFEVHIFKMNFIVDNSFSFPKRYISQHEIFMNQLNKFVLAKSAIAVLNSFPIFVLDYYGLERTKKFIS